MDYNQAWQFLDSLQFFKIKLGLDSMNRFLDDLGQPQRRLKFIHVAGTNGKGSVAATLQAVLSRAGLQVGLYTSPHLNSVRERFRINDEYISRREFAEHATLIRNILDGRQITYFEFTTALALLWFTRRQVDLVILEVGMGGRLDATNVIIPLVSVITNVSMDHEAYLGKTLEAVAREKAGIIKQEVPVVAGVADDASRVVVAATCHERQAPLYLCGRDFRAAPADGGLWHYHGVNAEQVLEGIEYRLRGEHQLANGAVVLATLEILASKGFPVAAAEIRAGLRQVAWPGRLEYVELTRIAGDDGPEAPARKNGSWRVVLDGAHNPAGVETLVRALATDFAYRQLILVWGSMADKDLAPMLAKVAPLCQRLIFTRPVGERAAEPQMLLSLLPEGDRDRAECVPVIRDAVYRAWDLAGTEDLVCIAGSLYLVGTVRKLLVGEVIDDQSC
jgi:dihydrofolate synthase / folylpolyglutamate synthase